LILLDNSLSIKFNMPIRKFFTLKNLNWIQLLFFFLPVVFSMLVQFKRIARIIRVNQSLAYNRIFFLFFFASSNWTLILVTVHFGAHSVILVWSCSMHLLNVVKYVQSREFVAVVVSGINVSWKLVSKWQ
jgi:hypothetical protein